MDNTYNLNIYLYILKYIVETGSCKAVRRHRLATSTPNKHSLTKKCPHNFIKCGHPQCHLNIEADCGQI